MYTTEATTSPAATVGRVIAFVVYLIGFLADLPAALETLLVRLPEKVLEVTGLVIPAQAVWGGICLLGYVVLRSASTRPDAEDGSSVESTDANSEENVSEELVQIEDLLARGAEIDDEYFHPYLCAPDGKSPKSIVGEWCDLARTRLRLWVNEEAVAEFDSFSVPRKPEQSLLHQMEYLRRLAARLRNSQ